MAQKSTPGWLGVLLSATTIAILAGSPVSGELFVFGLKATWSTAGDQLSAAGADQFKCIHMQS